MVTFINLVYIVGKVYWIKTNENDSILKEYSAVKENPNIQRLLHVSHNDNSYLVDLGKILTEKSIPIQTTTIKEFIDNYLTPEILYSYQVDTFNFSKYVRCYFSGDVPHGLKIETYSIAADEASTIPFDPAYNDTKISSTIVNFNKVFPIVKGKIRNCLWDGENVYMKDLIVDNAERLEFISFAEANDVTTIPMSEVRDNNWIIAEEGVVPIVVLNGKMFYDEYYIYKFNRNLNKLTLSPTFVMTSIGIAEHDTFDELIEDDTSFVILVKCNQIYQMSLALTKLSGSAYRYATPYGQADHLEFMCIDESDHTVKSLTVLDDKYKYIGDSDLPKSIHEHYAYIGLNSGNVKLLQLLIT